MDGGLGALDDDDEGACGGHCGGLNLPPAWAVDDDLAFAVEGGKVVQLRADGIGRDKLYAIAENTRRLVAGAERCWGCEDEDGPDLVRGGVRVVLGLERWVLLTSTPR